MDVTRRWPRRTDLVLVAEHGELVDGVVEDVPTVQDRAARDTATADALRAYLSIARPDADAAVSVRL